jgi:hypothetical protein
VEGYEHNEIAEMLGCSVGNSKSQLHKARMKLRDALNVTRAEGIRRSAREKRKTPFEVTVAAGQTATAASAPWSGSCIGVSCTSPLSRAKNSAPKVEHLRGVAGVEWLN